MAYKSSVNLGLDNIADPPEPSFFGIFTRVYNAIRNLAIALDTYTGTLDPDAAILSQLGTTALRSQNLTRFYCIFGVDITAGQVVHLYNDAGVIKAELASALTSAKPMHGWCSMSALAGGWGEVMLEGKCELIGGLTPGGTYYLGDTAGTIAPTAGITTQIVGFALGASTLFVDKDFLGSGGGGGGSTTLTGDVTGSGTGSFATTIAADAVTFAKFQNVSSGILLGRGTAGSGDVEEITLGTNLSLSGTTLNASGGGGAVSFTAATITVPTYGSQAAEVTVVDASITALSKISISWGNFTDADENTPDMDSIQFNAIPAAGSMVVRITALDFYSSVGGAYKINYLIG